MVPEARLAAAVSPGTRDARLGCAYHSAMAKNDESEPNHPAQNSGKRPQFRVIVGGRPSLERRLMWAAALCQPEFDELYRRLRGAGNSVFVRADPPAQNDRDEPGGSV